MKKMNLYLWLIALVGLVAACSNDDTADALQTNESKRVTLTASLPADFAKVGTRALPSAPDGYQLRCILEVWTQDGTPVLKHREEQAGLLGENVQFDFTIDEGKYDCLFWADYIADNAVKDANSHYPDKYYTTDAATGLKAIEIIIPTREYYAFNTDARDAFFGSYVLEKTAVAIENLPIPALTRPFAKMTIKEKDAENYAACTGLTAAYYVPYQFNVLTGAVGESLILVECKNKLSENQELFFDYIFTEATSISRQITMNFTGSKTFQKIIIPAGIPLKRNYKTIASGTLITEQPVSANSVKLTVTMDNTWSDDVADDIDVRIWDGKYPTSADEAKTWLGEETDGRSDEDGKNHVFTITAARQLAALQYLVEEQTEMTGPTSNAKYSYATYKLATYIDLNNHEWKPIGSNINKALLGTFDGQNHTISNLYMNGDINNSGGLFGCVTDDGIIQNVTVKGKITSTNNIEAELGGIVGKLIANGKVLNCINYCDISNKSSSTLLNSAGGIVGYAGNAGAKTISGCKNYGTITSLNNTKVGGIVGEARPFDGSVTLTDNTHTGTTSAGGVKDKQNIIIGYCYQVDDGGFINVDGTTPTYDNSYPVRN